MSAAEVSDAAVEAVCQSTPTYAELDADHHVIPDPPVDGTFENCSVCGAACDSMGRRHGDENGE